MGWVLGIVRGLGGSADRVKGYVRFKMDQSEINYFNVSPMAVKSRRLCIQWK